MKKLFSYFLLSYALVAIQLPLHSYVNVSSIIETSASSISCIGNNQQFPIPMLVKTEQISPNQIQVSYDRDVDIKLGTKTTNYWVQDMMNVSPKGIATLGKNDKVNARNSLTDSLVKIEPLSGSSKIFILTFNQNIPKNAQYKLIICYVTVEGAPPYNGDNGSATFVGK